MKTYSENSTRFKGFETEVNAISDSAENKINSRYRFEVRNNQNNKIEGTGCFTHSKEDLDEHEQLSFLHKYTHNMYKNKEQFLV